MPHGIIIKGIGGFYYIKTSEGVYECRARGIFRKQGITPLPGDRVSISIIDEKQKTGLIDEILPRESQLVRPAVANINQIIIVIAIKSPTPDYLLLDKLLVTAEMNEIKPIICINKIDLCTENEHLDLAEVYKKAGYKVFFTSYKRGSGFDDLKDMLQEKITVFAGQSGVGKSTILNMVMETWVMQTGELSSKIERGRHTTRHAELVELDCGGYLVDTPGFSSFELDNLEAGNLTFYYPDFLEHSHSCKFPGCSHISEPECNVREALHRGLITEDRYNRYVQLYGLLNTRRNYF